MSMEIAGGTESSSDVNRKESEGPRKQLVRRRILVVEDDPAQRELLVELLSGWGYDSVPVGSAEEAEFAVKRRRVDAAIVDVFLPGRSGAALMTKLRERFPEVLLIGISALGDASMARTCKGVGADLFISKPVMPEDLAQALMSRHTSWH
jgi:CheY-like chemotaxis protein